MNITHICLAGPMTDNWSYQENLLAKYHRKMGYQVTMIASRWVYDNQNSLYKFPKTNYCLEDGTHIVRLEIRNKDSMSNRIKRYSMLYETLENERPNIIFIHGCQFLDIRSVVEYVKKHLEVKIYVDNHADFSNSATNYLSKKVLHGVIWKSCAKCIEPYTEKFFGVLPARVDFLKNVYKIPEDKLELLVMGADDEQVEYVMNPETKKKIRKKYGILEDDFLVMTGGKIDKAKWQTLLLMEAIGKIEDSKVKLIVFGSVDAEFKERVDELSDGDKIQYVGWIDARDSYAMFAATDLAVFPGRHSVFWEQVAGLGVPMLCKEWAGTTHVDMGGNVRFLKEDSFEEIYNNLKEMTQPEVYQKMKSVAEQNRSHFLYSGIAKRSIGEA